MSTLPHPAGPWPRPVLGPPWQLFRSLGRGGIGEVFEALHPSFGRVAVKALLATHQDRADVADRMRLEAEVLAHLRHPNIVELYEMGSTLDGRPFYAMEYLTGASLRAILDSRGRLPSDEAVRIARECLAGLGAAHAAGIVHRDVKPGNLYLVETPAGQVTKLVDFGLAKLITTAGTGGPSPLIVPTGKGTVLGTPRYLAPEQIVGDPVDARTDLYAVGLVLYRMLVGKGPFDHIEDFADVMRAQVTVMPPRLSSHGVDISRRLDLVVTRALAKKPDSRFGTAAEFAHELERALDASEALAPCAVAAPAVEGSRVDEPSTPSLGSAPEFGGTDEPIVTLAAPEAAAPGGTACGSEGGTDEPLVTLAAPEAAAPGGTACGSEGSLHASDPRPTKGAAIAFAVLMALAWLFLALTWSSASFGAGR